MDEENNTERKFHDYGVGVYADDAERVAKVTAFIQETFEGCAPESYTIREKAPAQDGNLRAVCTFGMALQAMKCGKGARRPGGETIWLAAKPLSGNTPFFFYENEGGQNVVHPNIFDMLAEDWEIVDWTAMYKEHAEQLTETTYGEYTMTDTLERIKELAGALKNALAEHDNAEDKRKEIYDLAETLDKEHHGKLIVALAASHAAKYGEDYLPEKARTWLQRHEWVRTLILILLTQAAAWGLNSCASSVKQVQPDGTVKERTFIVDGATATQLIKLYGIPQVPTVNYTK